MKHEIIKPELEKMTDDELFAFLDAEAARIRRENIIRPLSPKHIKYARIASGHYNDEISVPALVNF